VTRGFNPSPFLEFLDGTGERDKTCSFLFLFLYTSRDGFEISPHPITLPQ
jgi:hypothetical protein